MAEGIVNVPEPSMSETRSRIVRRARSERGPSASPVGDGAGPSPDRLARQCHDDIPVDTDCGEIAEGGSGLGVFYAYQLARGSIERD